MLCVNVLHNASRVTLLGAKEHISRLLFTACVAACAAAQLMLVHQQQHLQCLQQLCARLQGSPQKSVLKLCNLGRLWGCGQPVGAGEGSGCWKTGGMTWTPPGVLLQQTWGHVRSVFMSFRLFEAHTTDITNTRGHQCNCLPTLGKPYMACWLLTMHRQVRLGRVQSKWAGWSEML